MDKKDVLRQLEIVNDAHKKPKRVIRIGKKDAQEVEGPHPIFDEGEQNSVDQKPVDQKSADSNKSGMPDKYFVDKRMLFFDRELMLNRIQKIMKGEVLAKEIVEPEREPKAEPMNETEPAEPMNMSKTLKKADEREPMSETEPKAESTEPIIIEGPSIAEGANKPVLDAEEIIIDEVVEPEVFSKDKKKRVTKKQPKNVVASDIPSTQLVITEKNIADLVPKKKSYVRKISPYYMSNRRIFVQKLGALFKPHADELAQVVDADVSCENRTSKSFDLLTHQKVVADYLNTYTPYRGLLIYHGLGSGKTCTSIAIAEGMKSDKEIVIMTPASLKTNFFSELKKCGDDIYRRKQHWVKKTPTNRAESDIIARALSLDPENVQRNGVWLMNIKRESNFDTLSSAEQAEIDQQLDKMIRAKYQDINYNGLNSNILKRLTKDGTINPFDHKVVIVDEAHNFISRIVNKLKAPDSINFRLYEYLLSAVDAKVVFLSGTPIINYPNEIAVMFNMLHGYIKTWKFPLTIKTTDKIDKEYIMRLFSKERFAVYDYLEYSGSQLTVTRNPYGFVNTRKKTAKDDDAEMSAYGGVSLNPSGNISDADFEDTVIRILGAAGLEVSRRAVSVENIKSLPDETDAFLKMFVDPETGNLNNAELLKRRILGLTSYFRSAQEQLLPKYEKTEDFQEIRVEMSDYQLMKYAEVRKIERERDKKQQKKQKMGKDLFETSSTYRIFSRELCNFVFPEMVLRPGDKALANIEADEGISAAAAAAAAQIEETADVVAAAGALAKLVENGDTVLSKQGLAKYSPKFLAILENIEDPENIGLHLLYSQFRTLEGIGIMKIVLEYHGFVELKLVRTAAGEWDIGNIEPGKQRFVLYTGTETAEEKEILRHIYNSNWDQISPALRERLELISPNNYMGEVIKLFMITSSGAEGINLENTRFVHIVEPYWHPVRTEQVIGRARRICSHKNLPEELRTIHVFMYLSVMSEAHKVSKDNIELITRDLSRMDQKTPLTTDEYLFEISNMKDAVNRQILKAVKETAIDCSLYKNTEGLVCYGTQVVRSNDFSTVPDLVEDATQRNALNFNKQRAQLIEVRIAGKDYLFNEKTTELFDRETKAPAGKLVNKNGRMQIVV